MPGGKLSAWHGSHRPDSSAQHGETHPRSSAAGALWKNLLPTATLHTAEKPRLLVHGSSGVPNNRRRGFSSNFREHIVNS